jgi:hypothetical protein
VKWARRLGVGEGVVAGGGHGHGEAGAQPAGGDPGDEAEEGAAHGLAGGALELEALGAEEIADGDQADAEAEDAEVDGVGEGELEGVGVDGEVEARVAGSTQTESGPRETTRRRAVARSREVLQGEVGMLRPGCQSRTWVKAAARATETARASKPPMPVASVSSSARGEVEARGGAARAGAAGRSVAGAGRCRG